MTSAQSNPTMDWLVATVRWLSLLGITVSLALAAPLTLPLLIVLIVAAGWNATLTALAALQRRLPAHRLVSVAVDMLIAYTMFLFSGGMEGELVWVGLLPLMTASLYFSFPGGLLVMGLNVLVEGLISSQSYHFQAAWLFAFTLVPLYLLVGALFSFLGLRVNNFSNQAQRRSEAARQSVGRQDRDRRQAIYRLISTLSATLNYQRVLETTLDTTTEALTALNPNAEKLVGAVLLYAANHGGNTELQVGFARRLTAADQRLTLPGTAGLIGQTIDSGQAQFSNALDQDPELNAFVAVRVCAEAYCIPLRTGLDTYGVLLFAHPDTGFFSPEHRELLETVGNQVGIAIQNARLYQDLEKEKERILDIQEEARKKMARDLHDGPTQSISAIAMRVNFARRLVERDTKAAAEELYKIEELARRTTKEIRHMLFTLRPLVLESQGLIAALQSMADKMHETYNQNVAIQADESLVEHLETGRQAVIFYIAEEAVTNARKHAKAANVWVRLQPLKKDLALLEIEDDGVGFDPSAVDMSYESRGSLGMVNMRERAELVNSVLRLESTPGSGTRVQVIIPLTDQAAERMRRGN